jgi:hypothetical protein
MHGLSMKARIEGQGMIHFCTTYQRQFASWALVAALVAAFAAPMGSNFANTTDSQTVTVQPATPLVI